MSENCCKVEGSDAHGPRCPSCGAGGRPVGAETVQALLREPLGADAARDGYRFCSGGDCDVVYFHAGDKARFPRSDLTVPVWQKEGAPSRPVCYCFGHTVASIHEEIRRTGKSTAAAEIKAKAKAGLCACEVRNPQGSCCLGNVNAVVKEARALSARPAPDEASQAPLAIQDGPDATPSSASSPAEACCAAPDSAMGQVSRPPGASRTAWVMAGSAVAAVAASACCWLPLVLAGAGLSAAGAGAAFEQWRPVLLGVTGLLLAAGFYFNHRRTTACAPGSACEVPDRRARRLSRLGLWAATVLVLTAAAFPHYVGALLGAPRTAAATPGLSAAREIALSIEGMTCEGCAAHIQSALLRVPGVVAAEADYATKTARVGLAHAGDSPGRPELARAVEKAGYRVASTRNTPYSQSAECCAGGSTAASARSSTAELQPARGR